MRARVFRTIYILALLGANVVNLSFADHQGCEVATQALKEVERLRGLIKRSDVPCIVSDRPKIEQFLRETIATQLPPDKVAMEQLVYRAIGVVPENYNYVDGIVQLYVNSIGGYYDPEKRHFIMAAWMPDSLQSTVAVHELTHALQDQHFNLKPLMDPKHDNGDELMARSALIEGDASAVMTDYVRGKAGQPSLREEKSVDVLLLQQVMGGAIGVEGGETPPALRSILIFPYTSGLRFVHRLLKKGGYAEVDRAFHNPPRSSREILHPELYFARISEDKTSVPNDPGAKDIDSEPSDGSPIYLDTIGEFAVSAILSAGLKDKKEAVNAATGWTADRVGVFRSTSQGTLISWKTRWESEGDAQEFFAAYQKFLEARHSQSFTKEGSMKLASKTISLRRIGTQVSIQWSVAPKPRS